MAEFRYTALDRTGKQSNGTVAARDVTDAAIRVRGLGLFPVDVKLATGSAKPSGEADSAGRSVAKPLKGGRVTRVHVLLFTRELADLIDAGLPIDRALSVLIEQAESTSVRSIVQTLQEDVRAGKPLSDALERFPRQFPTLFTSMIRAGEVAGQLPGVMTRLADFMEKEQVRKSQVISALTYPMVLITVAIAAVTILLTYVIPKLQDVFKELGAALPLPTQILLGVSGFIVHYWWAIILTILAVYSAVALQLRTRSGRRRFDGLRLRTPLVGALTRKIVMARFVRTLGTLLHGGVPILESLRIAGAAVGNAVTEDAIDVVRDGVRQGENLSSSMDGTSEFLPIVIHMTAVGEETGRLPGMLIRTSDTLDFEVDNAMRRLTSLVEPVVVLLMGGFVGFVVLSILLPIFSANTIVK